MNKHLLINTQILRSFQIEWREYGPDEVSKRNERMEDFYQLKNEGRGLCHKGGTSGKRNLTYM